MMFNQTETEDLIERILNGDGKALEDLLKSHQDYIYNLCRSMFLNPMDAEDTTQEILIKTVSSLSKYDKTKARFSTWLYRITVNHTLTVKKKMLEELTSDFESFGRDLDSMPNSDFQKEELERPETKLLIEEAKLGCSMGMLLCLDRDQRIVFVLGEIMRLRHRAAAEILEITPDSYRQKLSRARRDLFNFMENRCGLINKNNICRCEKKTLSFINAGWIDRKNLKFADSHLRRIREAAERQECIEDEFSEKGYDIIYDENPYYENPKAALSRILAQLEPEFIKKK
ncbi:MAG TPA: RNA polymerase sigma factor [Leptospiraceae bacterium]|nr:RNA polymerase sigma factor [Leptospiraceae bacterium]HMY66039.1 RNA polymerase sigma factor [Leptospiraceae bacterium]HNF13788.1 RNA polymerase sigma factor [Leptospiraceae bacterium]HNF24684.1 RNA polymerase sigma factor [Leptospiraceae bacterium]HNI98102.1 RNA polymerase sigma factor [Leptospiraceae bacterium]